MGKLEPGARECIGELVGILKEVAGDLLVGSVKPEREIGGEHGGQMFFPGVKRIGNARFRILSYPLVSFGRTPSQLPIVLEEVLKIVVGPLGRCLSPSDLQTAGDGIGPLAAAEVADPAESLFLDLGCFGSRADMTGRASTMALSEGMASSNQRHGLLVIHCHPGEGLPDIPRGGNRVGVAIGSFGVHIDESHLHGGKRVLELAVTAIALVIKPFLLGPPVNLLRFPDIFSSTCEAECFEAHRLQGDVTG